MIAGLAFAIAGAVGFSLPSTSGPRSGGAGHRSSEETQTVPRIALAKEEADAVTRIDLTRPDEDDEFRAHRISLEKMEDGWDITFPIRAKASQPKVSELLENVTHISIRQVIDDSSRSFDDYDLNDRKGLHVQVWNAQRLERDLYLGKTDARGQIVRSSGVSRVFAIPNWGKDGYSGFLYTRNVRSWRENSIVKFDEGDVDEIEIVNVHGELSFSKTGGVWVGIRTLRDARGNLKEPDLGWKTFDADRVRDFLLSYKSLSADDYGDDGDRALSGVDSAEETGGTVRIKLKGKSTPLTIKVGKVSTRQSPWAIKGNRWATADDRLRTLFVLSPYTAVWALADSAWFERKKP